MESKEKMKQGWIAREAHEFQEAHRLLQEALEDFKEDNDWFNVTECLNHLAYSEKIQAVLHLDKGLNLAEESLDLAEDNNVKKAHIYRALLSLTTASCQFEKTLIYGEKCLALYDDPLNRADVLSHMARAQLRTGDIAVAKETIETALNLLEENSSNAEEPHLSIWKASALITKGFVLYNLGKISEARKIGRAALELAQKADLKTRHKQALQFLKLFE